MTLLFPKLTMNLACLLLLLVFPAISTDKLDVSASLNNQNGRAGFCTKFNCCNQHINEHIQITQGQDIDMSPIVHGVQDTYPIANGVHHIQLSHGQDTSPIVNGVQDTSPIVNDFQNTQFSHGQDISTIIHHTNVITDRVDGQERPFLSPGEIDKKKHQDAKKVANFLRTKHCRECSKIMHYFYDYESLIKVDPGYSKGWWCSACESDFDSQDIFTPFPMNRCVKCNIDYCQICIAEMESSTQNCPKNHGLKKFKIQNDNSKNNKSKTKQLKSMYNCDVCNLNIPKGKFRYGCEECNYDLCKKCHEKQ